MNIYKKILFSRTGVLSLQDGGVAMGMGVFQVGAGLILYTLGSRSLPAAELALLSLAEVTWPALGLALP
jgi:hypothetical protein